MRFARFILALYVLVWFNVIVPIHTRGIVTLPGAAASSMGAMACCTKPDASKTDHSKSVPKQKPCAVCYVASTYTVPLVFSIDLQPAARASLLNINAVPQVLSWDYPSPYWPLGPPAVL